LAPHLRPADARETGSDEINEPKYGFKNRPRLTMIAVILPSRLCEWLLATGSRARSHVSQPICTYMAAEDGFVIFPETLAVHQDARIGQGDLGIWSDAHVPDLRALTDLLHSFGESGRSDRPCRPQRGFAWRSAHCTVGHSI
jgi:hypothetical protein